MKKINQTYQKQNKFDEIKKIVLDHWSGNSEKKFFPAPQPVSIERSNFPKIKNYFFSEKNDGTRMVLLYLNGKCYSIIRSFKISNFNLKIYPDINTGIVFLLDGEYYEQENTYIIHDAVNIYGEQIKNQDLINRLDKIRKMLAEISFSGSKILLKTYHRDITSLIENKSEYKNDGIIFTPIYEKVGHNTQLNLYKWKPVDLCTFDFVITTGNDGILALVQKNGELIKYAQASAGSIEEKNFLNKLSNLEGYCNFKNGVVVECKYNIDENSYEPIKIRYDKTYPNGDFTVKKTLFNIEENITLEELEKTFGRESEEKEKEK